METARLGTAIERLEHDLEILLHVRILLRIEFFLHVAARGGEGRTFAFAMAWFEVNHLVVITRQADKRGELRIELA